MKLIAAWKTAHKLASVRLAALVAIVGAYFTAFPAQLDTLLSVVPEHLRPVASVILGLLIFTTAAGSRVVSFNDKQEPTP
mgnify:FL=1